MAQDLAHERERLSRSIEQLQAAHAMLSSIIRAGEAFTAEAGRDGYGREFHSGCVHDPADSTGALPPAQRGGAAPGRAQWGPPRAPRRAAVRPSGSGAGWTGDQSPTRSQERLHGAVDPVGGLHLGGRKCGVERAPLAPPPAAPHASVPAV
ncbi:hypothetical protein ABZ626_23730 [Streptomyces longispororuber]|uniref:hypothetical protein n=1 Tax=Streptomyces longispororuber TaxID=68230 RepID=UPI00340B9E5F